MTNLESDMTFPTYGGEVKPATGATCSRSARGCVAARRPPTRASSSLRAAATATPSTATAGATTRSCAPPMA